MRILKQVLLGVQICLKLPLAWTVPPSVYLVGTLSQFLVPNYAKQPSDSFFFTECSCCDGPAIRPESKQICVGVVVRQCSHGPVVLAGKSRHRPWFACSRVDKESAMHWEAQLGLANLFGLKRLWSVPMSSDLKSLHLCTELMEATEVHPWEGAICRI